MTSVDKDIAADNARWTFSNISDSFEEHVRKSVPLYEEGHDLVGRYSDFFVKDRSLVCEIGCSTGALSRKLLARHQDRGQLRFLGIDPVEDMVQKARERGGSDSRAEYMCDDAMNVDMAGADLIVSYYTLQFVPPATRQYLVDKIYQSLNWGGAFLLFEKVRAPDARFQDYAAQIYADFKLDGGFSTDEIVNKTRSLKGVLEPFSTQGNVDLLKRAGFVDVSSIMKWVCFEGFLAIK